MKLDSLTGVGERPTIEHCGEPMRWAGSSTSWEGPPGSGWESTTSRWVCQCGATLAASVRVPS